MIEISKLHHCTIVVADLEASRQFYVEVLGMTQVSRPNSFEFQGQWFHKNGYEIHTLHQSVSEQATGDALVPAGARIDYTRHFCFNVTDIEAAVSTLAEMKVPIARGPQPRGDGATQLYIYDPDRHLVELVYEPWA